MATRTEQRILDAIQAHEREFGRPLPAWAFYKRVEVAIRQRIAQRKREAA